MPPRTKTAEELALSGSIKKHPERLAARLKAPVADTTLGNVPLHFTPEQKKLWHEVLSLVPPNVITKSDRLYVEITVRLLEKVRAGNVPAISQLEKLLSKLGMNPLDRVKIQTNPAPAKAEDPYKEFA